MDIVICGLVILLAITDTGNEYDNIQGTLLVMMLQGNAAKSFVTPCAILSFKITVKGPK